MPLPVSPAPSAVDLLRWPVVGAVLRWRHVRTVTADRAAARRGGDRGARIRPAGRRHQPRHAPDLDPLPRPADRRAARRRQPLLRGLSDDPGARSRAARPLPVASLAALARPEMGGDRAVRRGPLRLRAVRSLGSSRRDRLAGGRPISPPRCWSTRPSAARHSASTSARSGSSTSSRRRCRRSRCGSALEPCARPARPSTASRAAAIRPSRRSCSSAAASWRSSCRPRSATSIARSASTACRRVRTTTWRSASGCRATSWPTIGAARRSAGCRGGPISRCWRCCSRSARCSMRSR